MAPVIDTTKIVNGEERAAKAWAAEDGTVGTAYACTPEGDCTEAEAKARAWADDNGYAYEGSDEVDPDTDPSWHHSAAVGKAGSAAAVGLEGDAAARREARYARLHAKQG